jgi:choice-of-anchor B domain-containing protein
MQQALFLCLSALGLVTPLAAHDGDPKLLDRVPPYQGPGFRSGRPEVAGVLNSISAPTFASNNVVLLSWIPLPELNAPQNANSLTSYVSASGREYALIGTSNGTAFVEVTDPGNPNIVAIVPGPISLWRDVRTYQTYAYSVSEGGEGIQVMNLANLDSGQVQYTGSVQSGGELATHTVFVDKASGFLYRAGGGSNGLRIYSLANPANPTLVASWGDRYVHEVTVVKYTSGPYNGKQVAFACSGFNGGWSQPGIDILDVTNKSNIQLLDRFFYSNPGYSHQCWPTPDMKYLYLNDELDEKNLGIPTLTKVFDIQNLSNPVEKPGFTNGNSAIGHNLYVKANRIYEANYTSGLRVFDSTNPLTPTEIAWFDTWPDNDQASFNGLWNVDPYLPSGVVIGSDIERGLFVWWIGTPQVGFTVAGGVPDFVAPSGQTFQVSLTEQTAGQYVAGSGKFHFDVGAGWVTTDLVPLGGLQFEASLPATTCGDLARFYFSAKSANGVTWTAPQYGPLFQYMATSGQSATSASLDLLEQPGTWNPQAPGDTATGGKWVHGNPLGTQAQPEDDHSSSPGVNCWFTGQGSSFGNLFEADVDGGTTTLTSPTYAVGTLHEPVISYWRWYSNSIGSNANQDVFTVQVSNDGTTWVTVEVVGPTGPQTGGGWFKHQFRVADFVVPTATVSVRFIASDLGAESVVEAAVDDLEVFDVGCPNPQPSVYCTAKQNSQGCAPQIGFSGTPSASSASPFTITSVQQLNNKAGVLFYGFGTTVEPFQGGTLCVKSPLTRTAVQLSGGNPPPDDCSGSYGVDFNALIQSGLDPALVAGAKVDTQYWSRDPADPTGFTTALSNALDFSIQP